MIKAQRNLSEGLIQLQLIGRNGLDLALLQEIAHKTDAASYIAILLKT